MNKLERVCGTIIADIASGRIPPGGKLPTFYELEKHHDVSRITVNACVKLLKCKGLLTSRERGGVFVSEKPPLLNRFAIIFPKAMIAENRFLQTTLSVLREESVKMGVELEIFPDFEPHVDNSDYRKLLSELNRMCIGGVAYIAMNPLPDDCELLDFPGIPVINASALFSLDVKTFADKAYDYLLSKKKRRIAVLFLGRYRMIDRFIDKRRKSNTDSPDHWFIQVGADAKEGAKNIVRLMFDCPKERRPNGLIITDDNLVEHALGGVFLSGVKVPGELEIVTHCNWPNPVASVIPVKKLGYDVRELVSITIDSLLKSRGKGGLQVIESVPLVPLFEEELH